MNGNNELQVPTNNRSEPEETPPNHWQLLRDMVVFQAKLALDGLRDLVLLPISLVAGIAGLLFSPDNPGKYFQRLLEFGRKTDIWINLFGATEHYSGEVDTPSSDAYVKKLEEMLISEYKRGGVVKNIKDQTDSLVKRIQAEMRQDESL